MVMRVALQVWIESRRKGLRSADFAHFEVLDKLAVLVAAGLPPDIRVAWVISEHYSRGSMLPVVLFERPDVGIWFLVRHNFLDWRLSVSSEVRLSSDRFAYLFSCSPPPPRPEGDPLRPMFFEGFPRERVFGYYEADHRQWSASIASHEALWATVFECMMLVGALNRAAPGHVGVEP